MLSPRQQPASALPGDSAVGLDVSERVIAGLPFVGSAAIQQRAVSRRILHSNQFRRLWFNVFVDARVPDTIQVRCTGLTLLLPEPFAFSHLTSMELLSLATRRDERIHVCVPTNSTIPVGRPGLVVHERLEWTPPSAHDGLLHVPPHQTWLDLATLLSLDELICLGDGLLTAGLSTTADFAGVTGDYANRRRGAAQARLAVDSLRVGADSPPETMLRLVLVRTGLPEPRINADVLDAQGNWLARPDLSYEHWKIAIEYEGEHHLVDKRQWQRDTRRDSAMQAAGWIVLRVTAADMNRPLRVVERVRAAIASRG